MKNNRFVLAAIAVFMAAIWSGCTTANNEVKVPAETSAANTGKLPITTSSEEARKEFLQGRDLADRLLAQDSLQHFDKAIALDPNFASAELARATSSNIPKEFFEHLGKAVSLADKTSEGEKLLILATEAGTNADPVKQRDYLEKVVAAYPNEERVHLALGNYYFGQQDYPQAIAHYKKSTELQPNFASAHNILGYAYRQNEDYANAEKSFQKYIELIPNDPNPYDSYAELLLKMGRFDESIAQYQKALSIDSNFMPSHVGIAADLAYMNKPAEALAELKKITDKARGDGDRRLALVNMTIVRVDSGNLSGAINDVDQQYALGKKVDDVAAMTGDLQTKGNILLEMGKPADAQTQFEQLLKMIDASNLSQELKDNAKLVHHANMASVALGKKDYATAKSEAEEFRKGAEASKNPALVRQAHQVAGSIALGEKDYDKAVEELEQTGQQNPQNLYKLCQAYQGKGDASKAKESCLKAARFNGLPVLNYSFVRTKAEKLAAGFP